MVAFRRRLAFAFAHRALAASLAIRRRAAAVRQALIGGGPLRGNDWLQIEMTVGNRRYRNQSNASGVVRPS
jgi:hypothetical protein